MSWETQDNVVGFLDECRLRGWRRYRGFHHPCRESGQAGVGKETLVSVAIYVDLVSDEFCQTTGWKQATYSISPSCPLKPVTTMRHQSVLVSLALLGLESVKEDDKQHCRIGCGLCGLFGCHWWKGPCGVRWHDRREHGLGVWTCCIVDTEGNCLMVGRRQ